MKTASASLAGLALLLCACGGSDESGSGRRSIEVQRQDFRVLVPATGRLKAAVSVELGPPSVPDVWNYNLKWLAREGQRVRQGEPVMRFDTTELDDKLLTYSTNLETTRQEREKEQGQGFHR